MTRGIKQEKHTKQWEREKLVRVSLKINWKLSLKESERNFKMLSHFYQHALLSKHRRVTTRLNSPQPQFDWLHFPMKFKNMTDFFSLFLAKSLRKDNQVTDFLEDLFRSRSKRKNFEEKERNVILREGGINIH